MECWACGEEVAEPVYLLDDVSQQWPLCCECDENDLRLVLLEQEAQRMIDQMEV